MKLTSDEKWEQLITVLHEIAGGRLHGPSGLEGLAISLGGKGLSSSVADGLHAVAEAIGDLANAVRESKE